MEKKDKINRVLSIYSRLIDGAIINKSEEALRFNVNPRSIERDIEDIRSHLDDMQDEYGIFNMVIFDREAGGL